MAYKIKCSRPSQANRIVNLINKVIIKSRFKIVLSRKENIILISNVRLKVSKDYCGNHPGPCIALFPKKHRSGPWLEGMDWVAFNDLLNNVLDRVKYNGNVSNSLVNIRRGLNRRIHYDMYQQLPNHVEWTKYGSEGDYENRIGIKSSHSSCPDGTPGILSI